eukprot:scaffold662_cov124-Skeletonema_dohrnii-CCMP3373.AAC.1
MKIHLFAFPAAVLSSAITGALSAEHSSFKEQVKHAYLRYVATSSKDASSVTDEQWEELDSMVSEPIIDTSPETFLAADAAPASPVSGWRSDLDWAALTSKLSSSASLIDTSYDDYADECMPEFSEPSPTNHALIDQPSGMCLPHLYFGWGTSWPRPSENGHMNQTVDQLLQDIDYTYPEWNPPADLERWTSDPTNPSLDLPSKVLFPVFASDVVAAVNFAKEHGLEISLKNSGHSYQGASSKKDTLLLNMNRYTHYAPTGIMDCDASILDTTVAEDLSNQPCLLTLAKGKSSLIRVGGGENFDKVYRAVIAANEVEGYKYHLVGGGAGTVSPMGWTWQGGLSGTTGGRLFGLGVDQVVQVEMVLPNGFHVKFGPTEWEDASADGFTVPRTKVVSGVCRSNPDEQDEEKWIWESWVVVEEHVGSSDISTSAASRLSSFHPLYAFNWPFFTEECTAVTPQFAEFQAQYMTAPSLLNVTKEHSLACGGPGFLMFTFCYGEEDFMQAWTRFLDLNNLTDKVTCLREHLQENNEGVMQSPKGYAEWAIRNLSNERFPGKVPDADGIPPSLVSIAEFAAVGCNTVLYFRRRCSSSGSDQASALSQAHRDAAFMVSLFDTATADEEANFWGNLFPKMFDISDKTNFPPVFGSNHAGFLTTGPLKDDWTKPCPREWTFEERGEKCISFQGAIYGTERLARLEAIKKAVDPHFIFNCNNCVGNNLPEASKSKVDESSPAAAEPVSENPSNEPSGVSSVSSLATAISAIAIYVLINMV